MQYQPNVLPDDAAAFVDLLLRPAQERRGRHHGRARNQNDQVGGYVFRGPQKIVFVPNTVALDPRAFLHYWAPNFKR